MNFFERQAANVMLFLARREVEGIMGSNWKGRVGGIAGMLGGIALVLRGLACALGFFTGDNHEADMQGCFDQIVGGAGMFGIGLSNFGIRQAVSKVETKVENVQDKVVENTAVTVEQANTIRAEVKTK